MKTISYLLLGLLCGLLLSVNSLSQTGSFTTASELNGTAGELEISFRAVTNGLQVARLFDRGQQQELMSTNPAPLFTLILRHIATGKELRLASDSGWRQLSARKTTKGFDLQWREPQDENLKGISVVAVALADHRRHAWRWQLHVENKNAEWSVWRVIFPQIALADLGDESALLFPRGPGEVQRNFRERRFTYHGNYPGGWCSMQFMAGYREGKKSTGLYFAVHDPWGSTKDLALESNPATHNVLMRFEHAVPDMNKGGNRFALSGEAVWQILRGDWFDAAMIYKEWASKNARWWPRRSNEGRADTPRWMRELNVWALSGGAAKECASGVQAFQKFLGMPVGFHWYNWHRIPFDNDYPHYFPTKDGFAAGVAELQRSEVFVMPYINGRLWDTLDRGAEDFAFSRLALPAATKNAEGKPWLESYGSKETNGQPVRLAVMCPATRFWQRHVQDIVLKLLKESGTRSVYIDQVAAAAPALCLDKSHGHPLGGGHWWNEGYWQMLWAIRRAMPRDAMLTTECNGEPFVRWFDGYLTWHWQFNGQVPAFPAIYGGTVQMFGRAYRGGPTKDLALRMKAGQQLVFGEQLGWIDPGVINEQENAAFFRALVQLRARLVRYFHAGEMARPPKLAGKIPTVKADWQWSGEWWVTTDGILTGAWVLKSEKRLALLFVNVSDEPVTATLQFDAPAYGITNGYFQTRMIAASEADQEKPPPAFKHEMAFPPRQAVAWEVRW